MVRFLALLNFTDRGIQEVKQSIQRSQGFRSEVEKAGGKVVDLYWAVGDYDGAVIIEAPTEEKGAAILLSLSNHGFVRPKTLRIYDEGQFQEILSQTKLD